MKQMSPILKKRNAQFAQKLTIQKINVFSKINQIQPLVKFAINLDTQPIIAICTLINQKIKY